MATLLEQAIFIDDVGGDALNKRIRAAVLQAAADVYHEAPETTNHAARLAWAVATLTTPGSIPLTAWKGFLTGNPTIMAAGAACTDNDLQFVVNDGVNLFATPYGG